jgi:two-component system chemotaxis response regulator CheY
MKTLIVEDDFTSRLLLQELLKHRGEVHIAVNGREAATAVQAAVTAGRPYDLICLDIMMPEMDGHGALGEIRRIEEAAGVRPGEGAKVMMTTALADPRNVIAAYRNLCDAYLVKPIDKARLLDTLRTLGLAG